MPLCFFPARQTVVCLTVASLSVFAKANNAQVLVNNTRLKHSQIKQYFKYNILD